jgi:hypothetical protein
MAVNPNIKVPEGQRVYIEVDGEETPQGIPLIIEDDIQLSVSSSFGNLFGGGGKLQNILKNLGRATADITGQGFGGTLKQMGMQVWQSTDPLSLNLNFTFYLGIANKWDAFEEVKKPIFELMKLVLPSEGAGGTLVAPGPSPLEIFKGTFAEEAVEEKLNLRSISVDIGGIIFLPEIIVKKVEPVFSAKVDENNIPIWGQVSMDVSTLFIATSDMLEDELNYQNQTLSTNIEGSGAAAGPTQRGGIGGVTQ